MSPICLPLPSVFNVDYEDRTPEVAGWGAIDMYARKLVYFKQLGKKWKSFISRMKQEIVL